MSIVLAVEPFIPYEFPKKELLDRKLIPKTDKNVTALMKSSERTGIPESLASLYCWQ